MPRSLRLRPWQQRALEQFAASASPDFLAVATPGAGKTTFALTAALTDLGAAPHRRLVVVTPTAHLKAQWARAATAFGLHLEPDWSARDGRLPGDMHGVIVTYQQVAANPLVLRPLTRDAFVVFDELHHAGDERAWGDAVRFAFEPAARRLALSGTPFRSDTRAIPFVRYEGHEARPDFSYGYGDALAEGRVVRPVVFPRIDGEMEWTAADGTRHAHTFADRLDPARAGQRLRTALSLEGEWLPEVLRQGHRQLAQLRESQPDAGGLVIASDQDHARGIAVLLRVHAGVEAVVATSDDPTASARIARFAAGAEPWIVAVRMVSEGVDIPRLRVGVFATTTTTELFFRQAVGRLVRWTRETRPVRRQRAYCFIPDDLRLRTWAVGIAEERRHSLRREDDDDTVDDEPVAPVRELPGEEEQLSLFAPISAVATGTHHDDESPGTDDGGGDADADDGSLLVELAAPPPLAGAPAEVAAPAGRTRQEQKRLLRAQNADRAVAIVQLTGTGHAAVNGELNRAAGITRISEATARQLSARLAYADRWLGRIARRGGPPARRSG